MVSTKLKRGFLRYVYELSTPATLTLRLKAQEALAIPAVKGGTVSQTAANGHSVSFASTANGYSPSDFAEVTVDMRDLYDLVRADFIADGTPSPTDAQIYAEMMDRLTPIRKTRSRYTNMRLSAA